VECWRFLYDLTGKIVRGVFAMAELATTRMSSKGQVVIPEDVRQRLGLKAGDQFIVVGEGDVVILKTISLPSMKDFDGLVSKARSQARRARMRPKNIAAVVEKVREKKMRS
jgi:AbrB family looped-hinge helix DNA binding protein